MTGGYRNRALPLVIIRPLSYISAQRSLLSIRKKNPMDTPTCSMFSSGELVLVLFLLQLNDTRKISQTRCLYTAAVNVASNE